MGAKAGDVSKIRVERIGQNAQGERGGETQGGVVTVNMG
jgi:hypothetical protein